MLSLANLLKNQNITIIPAGVLRFVIYCNYSDDFLHVIQAIHKEYSDEIKEKRIKLKNESSYPTFCLGIKFKAKSDETFFLLKAN